MNDTTWNCTILVNSFIDKSDNHLYNYHINTVAKHISYNGFLKSTLVGKLCDINLSCLYCRYYDVDILDWISRIILQWQPPFEMISEAEYIVVYPGVIWAEVWRLSSSADQASWSEVVSNPWNWCCVFSPEMCQNSTSLRHHMIDVTTFKAQ